MLKLHGLRSEDVLQPCVEAKRCLAPEGFASSRALFQGKSAAQIMDKFRTIMGKFRTTSRFLRFTTSVKLLMTRSIRGFRVSYNSPSVDGTVHCVVRLSAAFIIAKILLCKNR